MLERAVRASASWLREDTCRSLAVNLSARNLLDADFPQEVARVLSRYGVPPGRLTLEITETTMMSEIDLVGDVLAELRDLGVELSVDDFGTGYSSLALLRQVAINEIKADRSFVSRMEESDNDLSIVRATIDLAHSLGLRVVAEGVENAGLQAILLDLGCDRGQGFHIARPMPIDELRAGSESGRWPRLPRPRRPDQKMVIAH